MLLANIKKYNKLKLYIEFDEQSLFATNFVLGRTSEVTNPYLFRQIVMGKNNIEVFNASLMRWRFGRMYQA